MFPKASVLFWPLRLSVNGLSTTTNELITQRIAQHVLGCKFDLTGSHYGILESPGYGISNYPTSQTCEWKITTNNTAPFTLTFDAPVYLDDDGDQILVSNSLVNFCTELKIFKYQKNVHGI